MNDKLNTLTARVITAETDIVHVKSRVADLEASSQGTGNLFDDVKESKRYSKPMILRLHLHRERF
jgi:hypothetical protein